MFKLYFADDSPDLEESSINLIIIIVPPVVLLFVIIVIGIIVYCSCLKKRLRRLSTSPFAPPDLVLNGKLPIVTNILVKSKSDMLSIPERPSIDKMAEYQNNVIFRLDLPKCRANMLAPISSRLSDRND